MKDFALLFRGGLDFTQATPEQLQTTLMKWKTWTEELARQGRYAGGSRLQRAGKVLKGKQRQLLDGPFTEGKEIVGGFIVIHADSETEAIEISKACPIFDWDGLVEVREVAPNP
jgi:hypothetical protein